MGKALRDGYRQKAFLMTKIDGRDKATAATQLDESLRRLQTDRIDLLQFHEVIRDTDPDRIFAAGGAMEVVLQAQKAGRIRYIGFTGHKSPDIHLKMLATASQHGFTFDSVQMPLNVMDAHFNSFEQKVLPVLTKNNIGVLAMKPMGDHFILGSKTVTALECLYYPMNLPTSVVITGWIRSQSFSRLSTPLAVSSRWTLPRLQLCSQERQTPPKRASSNSTKLATSLMARSLIHSGSARPVSQLM